MTSMRAQLAGLAETVRELRAEVGLLRAWQSAHCCHAGPCLHVTCPVPAAQLWPPPYMPTTCEAPPPTVTAGLPAVPGTVASGSGTFALGSNN